MKITHSITTLVLAMSAASFAGPVDHGKIVTPEPTCGPAYVALFGGGSFFDDGEHSTSVQFLPAGTTLTDDYSFENGWILGGAVGIRTSNNLRFELELSHSQAPGEAFSFQAVAPLGTLAAQGPLRGDVERTALMVNIAKEFGAGRFHPYVGAGVGLTYVDVDLVGAVGLPALRLPGILAGLPAVGVPGFGDDVVFSYQAMAGLGFDVTDCLEAFLEYRIVGHGDMEDYLRILPGDLDLGWSQHLILGMRYAF